MLPLESIPNFSEGRHRQVIDAIGAALAAHARVLDVHADEDHNRSVFTIVGDEEAIVAALLAGIACARERIDLRRHEGVHPRIGAADVVPVVAVRRDEAERARAAAHQVARRIGDELGLPVFLYAELGDGRGPAFFRRGGPEELQRRIDAGELARDPLNGSIAAVSCGIVDGEALCDLDYSEDSRAEVDANVVMSGDGGLVEVQATAERMPVSRASLDDLLALAEPAIARLGEVQEGAVAAVSTG